MSVIFAPCFTHPSYFAHSFTQLSHFCPIFMQVAACGKVDFQLIYITAIDATTASAESGDAVVLLGEQNKIVPHSPIRFSSEDRQQGTSALLLFTSPSALINWVMVHAKGTFYILRFYRTASLYEERITQLI